MRDILDLHTHTVASGHAYNTLYEMAKSAADKGLLLFGSSDHAPRMPGSCHDFYFSNLQVVPRTLFGIRILLGCELNILDYEGNVDLRPDILPTLDYAIASIHMPCYQNGTAAQNTAAYVGAMKNPYVRIIGHPDDGRFPVDHDTLAAAAKEHRVLLEVNSSSLSPDSFRKGARENYVKLLERCRHYGTSIIIDSDAHVEADVGNHQAAQELLTQISFPQELIVNDSLEKLAAFIPSLTLGGSDDR